MTKVINFFAGPGAGKSTTAAGLFFQMKCRGYKVELVTEYAKELCYEGRLGRTPTEDIVGEQTHRMERLRGQVDYIVTDSPLLKDLAYLKYAGTQLVQDSWRARILRNVDTWDNYNVWVERVKPYQPYGRRESEASARQVDTELEDICRSVIHMRVAGDEEAPAKVLYRVMNPKPEADLQALYERGYP